MATCLVSDKKIDIVISSNNNAFEQSKIVLFAKKSINQKKDMKTRV